MAADRQHRTGKSGLSLNKPFAPVLLIACFILWAHLGSGLQVFRSQVSFEPGWEKFRKTYRVNDFGDDGYFVRAVQNGYNVFHYTPKYAWRFTRKTTADQINACASCHTPADMAYSFVNSDRFDARLGRRVSFEERLMRCFADHMNGFIPTLYDPVVFLQPLHVKLKYTLDRVRNPALRPVTNTCTDSNGPSSKVFLNAGGFLDERLPGEPGYWDVSDLRPWVKAYEIGEKPAP